jgi:glycosyltransferase involved in cell wall biosynthesis
VASKLRIAFLTHEPFYPPSGGGSAEAVYLVGEMSRRGHEVHVFCPQIAGAADVEKQFGIRLHQFARWKMGRYARLRNFKYLLYPFFLERMVVAAARETKFDLVVSHHAISAVAAGKLKRKLGVPVVMNFPDMLTGFMETWPTLLAPRPLVEMLKRYEISMPLRFGVDGVLTVSDTLAGLFAEHGFPREKIPPNFRSARSHRRKIRPWSSCTAPLTRITSGESRSTLLNTSRSSVPESFSGLSGKEPLRWRSF